MQWLLHFIERFKPLYDKGGKLQRLWPLYEASEDFFFTSAETTAPGGPHVRDALDMKRVMITVVLALIPCTLFGIYNAGHQFNAVNMIAEAGFLQDCLKGVEMVVPIIFVSYLVGGLWEVFFACVRKHPISEGFLVTGLLFPLTLPPTTPLWMVALGVSFGIVIGKEIFGGVGFNVLNPALTARAFLFYAYPAYMSGDAVWTRVVNPEHVAEGFTGATPLAIAAAVPQGGDVVAALHDAGFSFFSMFKGIELGSIGETSVIPILMGSVILILSGVGSWRIMLGCLIGLAAVQIGLSFTPAAAHNPLLQIPLYDHVVMGSFLFGTVFMATDPVSAAATTAGKWIYGFFIGALIMLVRVANPAFPEGVMLSILFMNVMAPLIDYIVIRRHIRKRAERRVRHA